MSTSYEDKIKEQAKPYLEQGERVLAAFITQPRGTNVAMAGGLAPAAIGGRKVKEARAPPKPAAFKSPARWRWR